jgi:hypothetical protein
MPLSREDRIALISVASFGGFAGLLSFVNSTYAAGDPRDALGLALAAGLGAVSSMIFLFVIVNTDRSDLLRLISFALLAGFFYKPVFEIGARYIQERQEVEQFQQAQSALSDLENLKVRLAQGDEWNTETISEATSLIATVRSGVDSLENGRLRDDLLIQSRNLTRELSQLSSTSNPNLAEFSQLSTRELPGAAQLEFFEFGAPRQFRPQEFQIPLVTETPDLRRQFENMFEVPG